jgi:hypothetical protein
MRVSRGKQPYRFCHKNNTHIIAKQKRGILPNGHHWPDATWMDFTGRMSRGWMSRAECHWPGGRVVSAKP